MPRRHPSISDEEREYILDSIYEGGSHSLQPPVPWKHIAKNVPYMSVVVAGFCQNWGFYTLLTNLPTYLQNIMMLSITNVRAVGIYGY